MPRRRGLDDEDDWNDAPRHSGEMGLGSISTLYDYAPSEKGQFRRIAGPLGFDITPGQTIKPKRKRKV
jgi:hypothetical protein